jgi:iron-sulfur cluster protein
MSRIDPVLKAALEGFIVTNYANRAKSYQGYDFEVLREQLARLRDQALSRNAELLDQFQEKAEQHGAQVLRAKDSASANRLVLEIMEKHGARKLVKTKSMVSEETRLNEFLEKNGIEPRETDLGEWIVQLRGERPTHMVLPAIHLTRKEVAEVFSKKLGRKVPQDPVALVQIAREELRKEIFDAKVGLTGANALIAENGSIMMVTNEGNGRLVSTIPPVHIALASIEKVVPCLNDALAMLRLLPKSATGQVITSYVSFISGPHRESEYIILLDNHRSELLADPVFKETLRCIKCSSCLNYCPVYLLLGGAEYSHIYMGGIGTLLTAWIHGLEKSKDLASLCLGCHRCEEVCPAKVRITDLVVSLREKLNKELGKPVLKKLAFENIIARPERQAQAFGLVRASRKIIESKDGFARQMPGPLQKFDRMRSLPAPAEKTFTQLFSEKFGSKPQQGNKKVRIYGGCLVENFYPEIGLAATAVLSKLGYQVDLLQGGCCGFPALNSGFKDAAKSAFSSLAEKMNEGDTIITLCPTCTTMLSVKGPELMGAGPGKNIVIPFSRFIMEREAEKIAGIIKQAPAEVKLTFHESCHSKHFLKSSDFSRSLIEKALGRKILEMKNSDSCCGFAGTFSLDHPDLSEALLSEKLAAIKASGAEVVALDCPGCLLQIRGGCHRQKIPVRVKHIAEIFAELVSQ